MLDQSAHVDTFARDNLSPIDQWPESKLEGFDYPDRLNVGFELTDAMVAKDFEDFTGLIGNGWQRTYKELTDWTNRIAHGLVDEFGVQPGNRVLVRSGHKSRMCGTPKPGPLAMRALFGLIMRMKI